MGIQLKAVKTTQFHHSDRNHINKAVSTIIIAGNHRATTLERALGAEK